ncbi:hypothetical protein niasHT_026864 [Heterodera trifolii]|uniref:G-protein coupled receptors family 1 profile domain-containing protein n=1 Tax=Heterodera trifolii TaxID=157864 RepID=A0ABD2J9V0_9BILA
MDSDLYLNDSSKNNNYAIFQRDGVPLAFLALIVIRFLIAIIGILFNASLLYVAVNTYDLQGSCNFLIAFNAFCLVIFMPFMSISVFNHSLMPVQTCFWWELVPMFFGNLFMVSTLAVAFDRLLSVLLPAWHTSQNKEFNYLGSLLTLCILYAGCIVYFCYAALPQLTADSPTVICLNPSDSYQGGIGTILFVVSLVVVTLCILCYAIIWVIVRKNRTKWNGTFTMKILTSLSVLIFIISFGYFFAIVIRIISSLWKIANFAYITFVSSMFSTIAMAANAPVLYIYSSDYQNALRQHFPRLFKPQQRQMRGSNAFNNNNNRNWATLSLAAVDRTTRVAPINVRGAAAETKRQGNGQN